MSSSKCILKLGTQTATINPICGSVESWSVLDLGDILYPAKHDHPEFKGWPNGGCPILFPTPGRVYDKDDHQGILDNWPNENPLNIHGLAWELPWSVIQTSQNNCSMALISSAASRKLYPFEFEITQNIELHQTPRAGLSIEVTIKNPSNSEVLPYCFGFHPFFRTLSSGDLISLEAGQYFAINQKGCAESPLAMISQPQSIEQNDPRYQSCILGDIETPSFSIKRADQLRLDCTWLGEPLRYLTVWNDPENRYSCIEPWTSLPNDINSKNLAMSLDPLQATTYKVKFNLDLSSL
jgi:galactose mutarotase-like enzyme